MADVLIPTNEYQTPITRELLDKYPDDVQEQFMDFFATVPMLKWMVGERPRAKDLPRDEKGRIIVDVAHPHILEDMDYFRPAALHFKEHGCYTFLRQNSNPNSEFGRWLSEEMRRCRDGYVRQSDGEWVTGHLYFFLNYSPIILNRKFDGIVSRVRELPDFWEGIYLRAHYLDQARRKGKHCLELARRGAAKAHPYCEKVITPEGEKLWGDIQVGDTLFGDDGLPTKVIAIPFDGECDTYKITLRDGREILASDEHLWNVIVHNHSKREILSTKELLTTYKRSRKISDRNPSGIEYICGIPANSAVDFPTKEVQIDAYTLGVLLGDGCFTATSCYLSENKADFAIMSEHIPYEWKQWKDTVSYRIAIPQWHEKLSYYGLDNKKSVEKFIPDEYKYNCKEVRFSLLKGLMDTDGYLAKHEVYTYTTVSKRLADDVRWLCWSLGYNTTMTRQTAGYKRNGIYKKCNDSYIISIYTTDVITNLPRKTRGNWSSKYAKNRALQSRIVNIEYVGKMRSKCVTVDNASHSYLINDFVVTHNSFFIASMMAHNLLLGENSKSSTNITSILVAYLKEYLADRDGTFSKFTPMVDHCAEYTQFPNMMLKRSPSEMIWRKGYKNANGNELGSLNSVMGLSVKDDEGKIRGKRGFIFFEEMGNFRNFKEVWNNVRDSTQEGDNVFALLYGIGTAGDKESDFAGIRTMLYNPESYGIYAIENVYDKIGKGTDKFSYFFPSYISRADCMDKDGNSDVVKAVLQILVQRHDAKQSGDAATLLSRTAQMPITPAEAILKVQSNFFPVTMLNERLSQLDKDPRAYDGVYVGTLIEVPGGVEFRATDDTPIRSWPVDNKERGALEIYSMPPTKNIPPSRYLVGLDPVNNDQAESKSLASCIVYDLFTDEIVAEYTGRMPFAEDNYEMARLLCIFYNATLMYESNIKGCFQYFAKKHCTWMLADCPEYLRDRQLVSYSTFGSSAKGITVNAALIAYANSLIRDWLCKTYTAEIKNEKGEVQLQQIPNIYKLKNRALIQELIGYGPEQNVDRVRALSQVMLYREQFMILYGGSPSHGTADIKDDSDDDFFDRDWKRHLESMPDYKPTFKL